MAFETAKVAGSTGGTPTVSRPKMTAAKLFSLRVFTPPKPPEHPPNLDYVSATRLVEWRLQESRFNAPWLANVLKWTSHLSGFCAMLVRKRKWGWTYIEAIRPRSHRNPCIANRQTFQRLRNPGRKTLASKTWSYHESWSSLHRTSYIQIWMLSHEHMYFLRSPSTP